MMLKALFSESEAGAHDTRCWFIDRVDQVTVHGPGRADETTDAFIRDQPDGAAVFHPGGTPDPKQRPFTATGYRTRADGHFMPFVVSISDPDLFVVWLLDENGNTVDTLHRT